jgi:hypothetical protein
VDRLGYFAWLNPGMDFSSAWAAVFVLEAVVFVVAGVVRRDVVFRPRRDVSMLLGATFIVFALVVYPVAGLIDGHALHTLPVFGLSPCATVTFYFGLLVWAAPHVPKYLLVLPLAWALSAAPPNLARGTVGDYFMLVAAVITGILVIWRDRTSPGMTLTEGLLFSLMIVWSGHEDVLSGIAVVLLALAFTKTIRGGTSDHAIKAIHVELGFDKNVAEAEGRWVEWRACSTTSPVSHRARTMSRSLGKRRLSASRGDVGSGTRRSRVGSG